MGVARLILKEVRHRKASALLSAAAVAVAVALVVALAIVEEGLQRETRRVTRDLGFNLRIIPRDADVDAFYLAGYSDRTMSEAVLSKLAAQRDVSYNHLLATLEKRVEVAGVPLLVVGISAEVSPPGMEKPPMSQAIRPGTVDIGPEAARRLAAKKGDTLAIGVQKLQVARVLPESGTADDIRIFGSLAEIQRALGEEGRINEIKAIDCLCLPSTENPLQTLRREVEAIAPEAKVFHIAALADVRARERRAAERHAAFVMPIALVVCAVWIGVLADLNVRQRLGEIGLLRALGRGSATIAALFLGRAAVIGAAGAAAGYAAGAWLAVTAGPGIFPVTAAAMRPRPELFLWALAAAPAFAAISSFVPAMVAVTRDPADILRKE